MCGIFCALSLDTPFNSLDYLKFKKLTDLVDHRGPDASGYLALNTYSKREDRENFNIFLGHRRLSIIDLSTDANQPMQNDSVFLIYNGEIFNYVELREELIKLGAVFKTKSDSEVILKLYEYHGEDSFSRLNGMWAFICVDMKNNRVIVSRDRFSIKPLFTFRNGNIFFFASEIKQLLELIPSTEIDDQYLINFIQTGYTDTGETTFYKNINRIKSKFNIVIDLRQKTITEKQYWSYSGGEKYTEEDVNDRFKNLLIDSINIRLRSDVPAGVLLSGGLDSSSIALLTNNLNESKIHTYSIISNEKKYSEEKFIDLFTSTTGIKNHKLSFISDNILTYLNEVLTYQDEPFVSFSIIAQYLIFKELKEKSNIKVILSGQGADEILLGYLRYYFFYLALMQKEKKFVQLSREMVFMIINRTVIKQLRLNTLGRYVNYNSQNKKFLIKKSTADSYWTDKSMRDIQIQDIDSFSIPILTRYEDRNSMAHSLEVRLPFLDHRLVDLLVNLPVGFKLKKGWNKYILRKSMTGLPPAIRWRRDKKGFITPDEKWLKGELVEDVKNIFKKSFLAEMNLIDDKKFLEYYNSYLNGNRTIHNFDISRIYIAEKWLCKIYN